MAQTPELNALYTDILMDHTDDPRNFGALVPADLQLEGYNPLCGDRIQLFLKISDPAALSEARIEKCHFQGEGCSICMASTSMMTEKVTGLKTADAMAAIQDFRAVMQSKKEPSVLEGDLESLAGVRNFPVRIKCALLPWTTLQGLLQGTGENSTEGKPHV
jgi:nitrogen fixation NifU-like protein